MQIEQFTCKPLNTGRAAVLHCVHKKPCEMCTEEVVQGDLKTIDPKGNGVPSFACNSSSAYSRSQPHILWSWDSSIIYLHYWCVCGEEALVIWQRQSPPPGVHAMSWHQAGNHTINSANLCAEVNSLRTCYRRSCNWWNPPDRQDTCTPDGLDTWGATEKATGHYMRSKDEAEMKWRCVWQSHPSLLTTNDLACHFYNFTKNNLLPKPNEIFQINSYCIHDHSHLILRLIVQWGFSRSNIRVWGPAILFSPQYGPSSSLQSQSRTIWSRTHLLHGQKMQRYFRCFVNCRSKTVL